METKGIGHNSGYTQPTNDNPGTSSDKKATTQSRIEKLAASAQHHFAAAEDHKRQEREEIRQGVGELFEIYEDVLGDRKQQEELHATCIREKIPMRKFNLANCSVRYYGKVQDKEQVSRFANVLREAHERKVPREGLTKYLAQPRCGIGALHKAYEKRIRHQQVSDDSASSDASEPNLTDDSDSGDDSDTNATTASALRKHKNQTKTKTKTKQKKLLREQRHQRRRRDQSTTKPSVTLIWEDDTQQKFEDAKLNSSLLIRVRKKDNTTVRAAASFVWSWS
jgi:hypothetical protein